MTEPESSDSIRVVPFEDDGVPAASEWHAPDTQRSAPIGLAVLALAGFMAIVAIILTVTGDPPDPAADADETTFTPVVAAVPIASDHRHILSLGREGGQWRSTWDPTRIDGTLGAIGGIPAYTPTPTDSDEDRSNTLRFSTECYEPSCAITITPVDEGSGDRQVVVPGEGPVWHDDLDRYLAWTIETPRGPYIVTADLSDLSVVTWTMQFALEPGQSVAHWDRFGYVLNSSADGRTVAIAGPDAPVWSGVGTVVDATPLAVTVVGEDGHWAIVDRQTGSTLISGRRNGTIEVARASVTEVATGDPTETRLQIDLAAVSDQPTYEPTLVPTDDTTSIRIHRSPEGEIVTLSLVR